MKCEIDKRLLDYLARRFGSVVEAGEAPPAAGSQAPGGEAATALRQVRVLRWLATLNDRYEDANRRFTSVLSAG